MERMVKRLGALTKVTAHNRTWLVPRHYIALHGLKSDELDKLGFEEVADADTP